MFSDDIDSYITSSSPLLHFVDSSHIHLFGSGTIDGQGLKWWRLCYLGIDNRPNMVQFSQSYDIIIEGLTFLSSPKYTINYEDCKDIIVHDITIFINSTVIRHPNDRTSETYALNTDGIDIAATNVTIYNNHITNYDDAIVPKPCRSNGKYCQCSSNMMIYNNTIKYSVGLTIGSVPPNSSVNCVRNVTFKDSYMYRPFKGIYIKSNPGNDGVGIIEDITYDNIRIEQALWWTIWIGPQQQNQPGSGSNDSMGCNFAFPLVPKCPTQPLVTIKRVTLRNIVATNTLPLYKASGVILCDPSNPCSDFIFENVTNTFNNGKQYPYITTNVYGIFNGVVDPSICLSSDCFWVPPTN
jgi:polygalacturonase